MENLTALFANQASIYTLFAVSFLGGVIASVSPCSLSMLPLIIGYVGGYSKEKPLKTLVQMLFFVIGTSIVFSLIGVICAITGKVFVGNPYFMLIIASVILVMGLNILEVIEIQLPAVLKEMPKNTFNNEFLYPIVLGAAFALIGTPCSTPILASIMGVASISAKLSSAIIMLFLFSLGQGIILILAGFLTSGLKNNPKIYKASEYILKFSGLLLVFVSLYIYYQVFSSII